MGWFDEQIEFRKKHERELLSDSFENIARAVTGRKTMSLLKDDADVSDAVSGLLKHFGIREDRTVDYVHDRQGTAANYNAMNKALSSFRKAGAVSEAWADEAREDYEKRKGRRRK